MHCMINNEDLEAYHGYDSMSSTPSMKSRRLDVGSSRRHSSGVSTRR